MTNSVAVAGLIDDLSGAAMLASALAFETTRRYLREMGTQYLGFSPPADVARASDGAQALVGLALLSLGFIGQGLAAAGIHERLDCWIPYAAAFGTSVSAVPVSSLIRRHREAVIIKLRIIENDMVRTPDERAHVWRSYAKVLTDRGRGPRPDETIGDWAERRYGRDFLASFPEPPPDS